MIRRFRPERSVATVSVGLVALLAGLLFTVNARVSSDSLATASGLQGMVTKRSAEVEDLAVAHSVLEQTISAYLATADSASELAVDLDQQVVAGTIAVSGPGLSVTLSDSLSKADPSQPTEAYMVHQQDIDAVVAALWAGGAEAIAVQNHRLTSTTVIRCVGNVILVAGRVYAPPYIIEAIGPPSAMEQSLADSPQVKAYVEASVALGLGWSVMRQDAVELPAATDVGLSLRYAQAIPVRERTG